LRGIGERPANDDGSLTATGYVLLDLIAAYPVTDRLTVEVTGTNLLDAQWREAQFADVSRVSPTAELVEDVHFTPGSPLTVILGIEARY